MSSKPSARRRCSRSRAWSRERAGRVAVQLRDHVGDDGAPTAQVAESRDSLAQQSPAAPGAGPHPAVELAGCPLDPPRARPRADQHGWAAQGRGPDRLQRRSPHSLARPEPPHDRQRLVEPTEARGEIEAERLEVRGGRSGSYAEPQPPAGREVRGQHPLGELHGVSQRNLQDSRPQIDVAGHGGRDGKRSERIREKEPAADGVERPDALEARRFDPPGGVREALRSERGPTSSP